MIWSYISGLYRCFEKEEKGEEKGAIKTEEEGERGRKKKEEGKGRRKRKKEEGGGRRKGRGGGRGGRKRRKCNHLSITHGKWWATSDDIDSMRLDALMFKRRGLAIECSRKEGS